MKFEAQTSADDVKSRAARKRKKTTTASGSNKKFCNVNNLAPGGSSFSRKKSAYVNDSLIRLSPGVQCAFYAIERFRSSWKISHVSGVYLKGELYFWIRRFHSKLADASLQALWYDPQGCIKSSPIDIIRSLPLLVAMVVIQQSSSFLSGVNTNAKLPSGWELTDDGFSRRFQLVGRMTHCAFLKPLSPTQSSAPANFRQTRGSRRERSEPDQIANDTSCSNMFFKVSWPEDSRIKEGDIIQKIRDDVPRLLDMKYNDFVLKHIPSCNNADYISGTSTAIIRIILGIPHVGSRSQYWMMSKRLESLTPILSANDFKRMYWEIIRCQSVFSADFPLLIHSQVTAYFG